MCIKCDNGIRVAPSYNSMGVNRYSPCTCVKGKRIFDRIRKDQDDPNQFMQLSLAQLLKYTEGVNHENSTSSTI